VPGSSSRDRRRGVAGGGLRVLVAEHVLDGAQVVRVAIGRCGAVRGSAPAVASRPLPQIAVDDVSHTTAAESMAAVEVAGHGQQRLAVPSLTYWRVQRSMLQRELAERAGVHLRHVQRLEAGGRAGFDIVRLLATRSRSNLPS
jgi:hypothetical protein